VGAASQRDFWSAKRDDSARKSKEVKSKAKSRRSLPGSHRPDQYGRNEETGGDREFVPKPAASTLSCIFAVADRARRKIFRRLIPFLFILYIIAQ
jgi:hypothetical protein